MAFMTTNYSETTTMERGPLPEGTYEFIIKDVSEQAAKSGNTSIHFDLVVRNDLDQALPDTNGKYHNRHLWVDQYASRQTGHYAEKNLQYFMKAARIPEGQAIETPEDFFRMLTGKPVRIHVTVEENTYNGKKTKVNRPAPWDWEPSKFPQVNHVWKQQDQGSDQRLTPPTKQPIDKEYTPF